MEPSVWLWNLGQFVGYVLLLRYMQVQVRDLKVSLEGHMKESYTKDEVVQLIDLKQEPLSVKLDRMGEDVKEIKDILKRQVKVSEQ